MTIEHEVFVYSRFKLIKFGGLTKRVCFQEKFTEIGEIVNNSISDYVILNAWILRKFDGTSRDIQKSVV